MRRSLAGACAAAIVAASARPAFAEWGTTTWGALLWGSPPPAVPTVPGWAWLALAFALGVASRWLLRSRTGRIALAAGVVVLPFTVVAAQIGLPHQFVNGTIADANEVNANFQTLVDESNDQDSRLSALETWDMDIDAAGFDLIELGGATGAATSDVLLDFSPTERFVLRGPETEATDITPSFALRWPTTNKFGAAAPLIPTDLHISTTRAELFDGWDTVLCIAYNQVNCGGARVDPSFPGSKFQWEHDFAPDPDTHLWEINWDVQTAGGIGVRPLSMVINLAGEDPTGGISYASRPLYPYPKACFGGTNPKSFCQDDSDCLGGGTCTATIGRQFVSDSSFKLRQLPIEADLFNYAPNDGTGMAMRSYAIDRDDCLGGAGGCNRNVAGIRIGPDFETNHDAIDYRYIEIQSPTGTSSERQSNALIGIDVQNLNGKSGGFSHAIRIQDQSTGPGAGPKNGTLHFGADGLTGNHITWNHLAGGNMSHLWNDAVTDVPCFWTGRRKFGAADTDSPCAAGGWQVATHQDDPVIGIPVWAIASSATRFCDGGTRPPGFFCTADAQCGTGGTCTHTLDSGDAICLAKGEMKCIPDSVLEFGTGAGTLASLEQRACSTALTDGAMTIAACHQAAAAR